MRASLGTAAELAREIWATIRIRIARAPSRLVGAWAMAVVLVLAGLLTLVWVGGGPESSSFDGPTLGAPGGESTTTTEARPDQTDGPGGRPRPDRPASPDIADELTDTPADGSDPPPSDDPSDDPGQDPGEAPPTPPDEPGRAPTTTRPPAATTTTRPPAEDDDSGGLLGDLLDLLSGRS